MYAESFADVQYKDSKSRNVVFISTFILFAIGMGILGSDYLIDATDISLWHIGLVVFSVGTVIISLSKLDIYRDWRREVYFMGIMLLGPLLASVYFSGTFSYIDQSIIFFFASIFLASLAASANTIARKDWQRHVTFSILLVFTMGSIVGLLMASSLPLATSMPPVFVNTIIYYEAIGTLSAALALLISGAVPTRLKYFFYGMAYRRIAYKYVGHEVSVIIFVSMLYVVTTLNLLVQ